MGKQFGNLYKIRGIIQYRLSPFEQKPYAGFFTNGVPNLIRRIREEIFYILPGFVMAVSLYTWGENKHTLLQRKNPADFENDE